MREDSVSDAPQSAVDLLRNYRFPRDWTFRPVLGKKPMAAEWNKSPLDADSAVSAYERGFERKDGSFGSYDGQAVMTGERSGGLLALDIDGPAADDAFLELGGDAYEPMGEESTMAFTSGRTGRRQLLYRVPKWLVPELRDLHIHKLRDDADGSGELALRFNGCYSVLPGSKHPETGRFYRFTRDHDVPGTADAPDWIVAILLELRKAPRFLEAEALDELGQAVEPGVIPDRQLRGWFWKAEIQSLVGARLEEVIYNHDCFADWDTSNPRRASNFCPFHGGDSGDTFHVDFTGEHGYGWHCKVCGTGGNPLQYLHALHEADPFAEMPRGADLRRVIERVATDLGFTYPDDLQPVQLTREVAPAKPKRRELLEMGAEVIRTIRNPAEQSLALHDLVEEAGRFRLNARELKFLILRDAMYKSRDTEDFFRESAWFNTVSEQEFVIPGLLRTGSQVMIHARGGVGKSETMLALAKAIGRGSEMLVRGIKVKCRQGPVIWISSDQSLSHLRSMLHFQDIDPTKEDDWFYLVTNWKADQMHDFQEMINQVKPALVVIDSLGSVQDGTDVEENEGNYASALYQIATLNGDLDKDLGFHSTCIAWIHHNTKGGQDFRGTDRLKNALDETWSLRELTEEEEAQHGTNKRMLTIGKSRFGRSGDNLMVSRDLEFNYEITDMTPMVTREGINRTGRQTPETLILEHLSKQAEPQSVRELLERLNARLKGERGDSVKPISERGIRKYLALWLEAGMVQKSEVRTGSSGRPREVWAVRGTHAALATHEEEEAYLLGALARGFGSAASEKEEGTTPVEEGESFVSPRTSRTERGKSEMKLIDPPSNPFPEKGSEAVGIYFTTGVNTQNPPEWNKSPSLPEQGDEGPLAAPEQSAGLFHRDLFQPRGINPPFADTPVPGTDLGDPEVYATAGPPNRVRGRVRAHEELYSPLSDAQEPEEGGLEGGPGAIEPEEGLDGPAGPIWSPLTPFGGDTTPEGGEEGDFSDAWL